MLFSLNSERKFNNASNNTSEDVGPGIYNIIPVIGNKKKMKAPFGSKSERNIYPTKPNDAPPPGEYDPKPLQKGLAITSVFMSETKRKPFAPASSPDPTKYSNITQWGIQPSKSAKPMKYHTLQTTKMPGGYIGQADVTCYTLNDSGNWIPSKKKTKTSKDIGPGSYDPNPIPSKAIPITLGKRVERNIYRMNESFPGPGSYCPKSNDDKLPIKISTAPRKTYDFANSAETKEPEYLNLKEWAEPEYEGSAAFKSRNIRNTFQIPEPTPAPTAYYRPPRQFYSPGDGLGVRAERNTLSALNSNPGPGSYYPQDSKWVNKNKIMFSLKKSVGRSVSVASATAAPIPGGKDVPGPGKYNTMKTWVTPQMNPSSVFKSKVNRSQEVVNDVPAPGSYNPRITDNDHAVPTLIHESRFTTQGGWVDKNKIDLPAPNAYQSIVFKTGKGKTISPAYPNPSDKNDFPGPGTYNVVHSSLKTKCYNALASKDTEEEQYL